MIFLFLLVCADHELHEHESRQDNSKMGRRARMGSIPLCPTLDTNCRDLSTNTFCWIHIHGGDYSLLL